ncbi:TetR/AcrR family transcriptional regulator [Streptomyces sp. Li-HN-5-11]|uniref:TetR/AcrR family transcriptional regulator n=1 Tax=Streptomyces sp. Li-HN-5-11 TaxID=3075432 RepID=UPI0028AAA2FB|nr:TetR/AcrR family transcriptional regulator [Streptomyces sp. Li-HN-5-11]WNM33139.1 TetR/AcrR family transcriptional regulator [Streptomyces sp. Li-HN-5-11]
MANLVGRATSGRGHRRREQLINAGVALLADGGWPAVTTRAVAERAGTNIGLIHYYFGGLPGLHTAIARKAGDEVITPVVDALLEFQDSNAVLDTVRGLVPATTGDSRTMRLAVELMAGALRDPALGEVLCDGLREVRARIGERLGELHPSWSEARRTGAATVITALLDGLMLHRLLDASLPLEEALAALGDLIADRS